MSKIEELKKLNSDLEKYLQEEKTKKQLQEDKVLMTKLIGEQLRDLIIPVLEAFEKGTELTRETIKLFDNKLNEQRELLRVSVDTLSKNIENIKIDAPKVNIPPVDVKMPEINVPQTNVVVDTKNIEKTITEAFRGLKMPSITVPEPKVTVNTPKIPDLKWPKEKMPIEGWVQLMGVNLNNPLPVQLRTPDGKPLNLEFPASGGGGRSGLSQKDSNYLKTISESQTNSPMAELYRVSTTDSTVAYHGLATPGTTQTTAGWRLRKIYTDTQGDTYITWADGDSNFDNIWANREGLNYV